MVKEAKLCLRVVAGFFYEVENIRVRDVEGFLEVVDLSNFKVTGECALKEGTFPFLRSGVRDGGWYGCGL